MNQLIYIYNHEWILFRRTIGQLPQKKGKVKLPLYRGNVERVIPIYAPEAMPEICTLTYNFVSAGIIIAT